MSSWFEQVATGKKGFLESSGIANWRLVRLVERVGGKGKGTVFVDKYGYDGEKMALAAQGV